MSGRPIAGSRAETCVERLVDFAVALAFSYRGVYHAGQRARDGDLIEGPPIRFADGLARAIGGTADTEKIGHLIRQGRARWHGPLTNSVRLPPGTGLAGRAR
jgi:hypothetical protein